MLRNEILEQFLLGFGLQIANNGFGRPTNITQLHIAAEERCADCGMDELLDALYNLRTDHAELTKFVALPTGQFQPVSFNRARNTPKWSDFFMIGYFNIKILPAGRRRFEQLEAANTQGDDRRFARLVIEEAGKSISEQDGKPHPKVGAVVVKNGQVLSIAHRGEVPGNHAEYLALEKKLSGEAIAGSTVYTTLEPCTTRNHPKIPCAERLIEHKVGRVVIGMLDPDERISGRGLRRLRKAGIATDLFPPDLMMEVEEMNRDFIQCCEVRDQTTPNQPSRLHDWKLATPTEGRERPITVNTTKAFISYSWESAEHNTWVLKFAERLQGDGIEVALDRKGLANSSARQRKRRSRSFPRGAAVGLVLRHSGRTTSKQTNPGIRRTQFGRLPFLE